VAGRLFITAIKKELHDLNYLLFFSVTKCYCCRVLSIIQIDFVIIDLVYVRFRLINVCIYEHSFIEVDIDFFLHMYAQLGSSLHSAGLSQPSSSVLVFVPPTRPATRVSLRFLS
jgi:hypothetical protein